MRIQKFSRERRPLNENRYDSSKPGLNLFSYDMLDNARTGGNLIDPRNLAIVHVRCDFEKVAQTV